MLVVLFGLDLISEFLCGLIDVVVFAFGFVLRFGLWFEPDLITFVIGLLNLGFGVVL